MIIINRKRVLVSVGLLSAVFCAACGKPSGYNDERGDGERENIRASEQKIIYSSPDEDQANIEWAAANLEQSFAKKSFEATSGHTMPYRLFVPENYSPSNAYPLLVFLHGRGDRGSDNRAEMFRNIGLFSGPQSIVSPNMQRDYPSLVLIPQCADTRPDEEWAHAKGNTAEEPFVGLGDDGHYQQHPEPSASGAAALELVEKIIAEYAIDQDRVYITGVSMGGFGTWEFITRRPDLFAAAVPMAGYSDPSLVDKILHIPIWVFHGDQDEYNPVQGSRDMASLLGARGAEIRYSELRGLKHVESFGDAWENRQIIPWMYSKKRKPQS